MKEYENTFIRETRNWKSLKEFIEDVRSRHDGEVVHMEGVGNKELGLFAMTLSTCMWCKLGKKWLKEHDYDHCFLDVDKLPIGEKNRLMAELRMLTGDQVRYPFLVCAEKNTWHAGYDPSAWEKLLGE